MLNATHFSVQLVDGQLIKILIRDNGSGIRYIATIEGKWPEQYEKKSKRNECPVKH